MTLSSRFDSRGQNLPVSTDQINNRNFIEDERQMPRLRLLTDPQLRNLHDEMIKSLIIEIQNNAERNELRVFTFNFYGDRQFNNSTFADLAQIFATHVEMVCIQQNADPVRVMQGEIVPFIDAAVAGLVHDFPELENFVPSDADESVSSAMREWSSYVHQAKRYLNQENSRGGQNYDNRRGQSYNGGREDRGGRNAPNMGLNSGMFNNQSTGRENRGDIRPSWEMNTPRGGGPNTQGGGSLGMNSGMSRRVAEVQQVENREEAGEVIARGSTPSSVGIRSYNTPMPVVETQPVKTQVLKTDHTVRKYDKVVFQDGRVAVPAFKSEWSVRHTADNPPMVFNRTTHMLYYVRDRAGVVTEEILPIEEPMEYLKHELDESLKAAYRSNHSMFDTTISVPELLETRRLIPNLEGVVATIVSEEKRKELDESESPRSILVPIRACSLKDAQFQAQLEAARLDGDSEYLEYQVEQLTETNTREGALKAVLALRECKSFAELHKEMMNAHKSDIVDDPLFDLLDKRITAAVNRFCSKQLYLGYRMESFIGDYEELTGFIKERFGSTILERYLGGHKAVIARATSVLTGEVLSKYIANLPDGRRDKLDMPAIFTNRYSVTEVPWTSLDMAACWQLEGVVSKEKAGAFHNALSAIFNRTRTNDVHEHLIITGDSEIIYAYRGVMMPDTFTVTIDPPTVDISFFKKIKDL